MALSVLEMHNRMWKPIREPSAMRTGHHQIRTSLPHRHRYLHIIKVETPRLHQGQVVVKPAIHPDAQRLMERRRQVFAELSSDHSAIHVGKQGRHRLDEVDRRRLKKARTLALEVPSQRRFALEHNPELVEVLLSHTGQEVETFSIEGRHPRHQKHRARRSQQRPARQRISATTRPTGHQTLIGTKDTEHGLGVCHQSPRGARPSASTRRTRDETSSPTAAHGHAPHARSPASAPQHQECHGERPAATPRPAH